MSQISLPESQSGAGRVALFTAARLVINTAIRMAYPFLAVLGRGMGVSVREVSLALSFSIAASAIGPFIAPIADRRGRKVGMLIGLTIFSLGAALVALFPSYLAFFAAILLANLGGNVFVPAMQAYLGDSTPYAKRGWVLAVTEMSWALAFLLAMPLVGLLIDHTTWHAPFGALAGLGAAACLLIVVLIPNDHPQEPPVGSILGNLKAVFASRMAVIGLMMGFLIVMSNEVVNVMFGVYLEDAFGLQIAALGAASMVIGLSELGGEGLGGWLSDRLGKRRTIVLGIALNALTVLSLFWLGRSLLGVQIWLFFFYLSFETALVASLPLMTEVLPSLRATLMAALIGAFSLGRAAGALAGPLIYQRGFSFNAGLAVLLMLGALPLLSRIRLPKS